MTLKFIFISLAFCLSTGCAILSKECYLAASGEHVRRKNDDGALGEAILVHLGKGNLGIIKVDDYTVEVRSSGRYWKELSIGPVFPIFPRFRSGYSWRKETHSITIKNTSSDQNIVLTKIIVGITASMPTESLFFTCYGNDRKFPINQEITVTIPANECRQIFLPPNQSMKMIIQMGQKLISVNLNETTGVTWFYLWSV